MTSHALRSLDCRKYVVGGNYLCLDRIFNILHEIKKKIWRFLFRVKLELRTFFLSHFIQLNYIPMHERKCLGLFDKPMYLDSTCLKNARISIQLVWNTSISSHLVRKTQPFRFVLLEKHNHFDSSCLPKRCSWIHVVGLRQNVAFAQFAKDQANCRVQIVEA